jgi:hypothetical protein
MAHVILVAFEVDGDSPADAQARLITELFPLVRGRDETSPIECWWIAEDERMDGSDCDSAVFVTPGQQSAARSMLLNAGLTR